MNYAKKQGQGLTTRLDHGQHQTHQRNIIHKLFAEKMHASLYMTHTFAYIFISIRKGLFLEIEMKVEYPCPPLTI